MIKLILDDCMNVMKDYKDNHFDLAIVDPPYSIGADKPSKKPNLCKQKNGNYLKVDAPIYNHKNWDNKIPDRKYFNELLRISKNQIIWGVNYYNYNLNGGRIVWDKLNGASDQYGCEIAYQSFNKRTDIVRYMWQGMFQGVYCGYDLNKSLLQQGNKLKNEKRIHPTQKPVKLYEWLLNNYAVKGQKILDTHLGSGSIAVACHYFGVDLVGVEIDEEYYNKAKERIDELTKQETLF